MERVGEDFRRCGYDVDTLQVNALKKESVEAFAKKAAELGPVMYFIDTAGASPNQANPEHIVDLDMVGTGYAAAFLLGEHARFITGTALLIDGGVIAAIRTGEYQLG